MPRCNVHRETDTSPEARWWREEEEEEKEDEKKTEAKYRETRRNGESRRSDEGVKGRVNEGVKEKERGGVV